MAGEDQSIGDTTADAVEPFSEVDVQLGESPHGSKPPWGLIAGAGILVLALGVGAYAMSNGESEVDAAQAAEEPAGEPVDEADTAAIDDETAELASNEALTFDFGDDAADAVFEESEAMMDSEIAFGGSSTSTTVFDGERFASLANVGNGWALRTSTDGLTWTDAPVSGLDGDGYLRSLAFDDGTYAALLDVHDGNRGGATSFVVTSADGISWTSTALPTAGDAGEAGISGFAVRDGQAVFIQTTYNNGPDPVQILVDAGILSGDQAEMFCGFGTEGPSNALQIQVCDFDEQDYSEPSEEDIQALADKYDAATTDEERNEIELQLELLWGGPGFEIVATIEPGDPLHGQLSNVFEGPDGGNMTTSVLAGPITGPFAEVATLDSDRYYGALVQTNAGLFVSAESHNETNGSTATILTSLDGTSWTEVSAPGGTQGGQLQALGDLLFFTGYSDDGGNTHFVSTNGAESWTTTSVDSALFDSYTQFVAGDAGIVAFTQGTIEPFPTDRPDVELPTIVLERDGYVLEMNSNGGDAIFSTANGTVIYTVSEEEMFSGFDGVRQNPISGTLTFLDPEDGADLVTFTEDDWNAAFEEVAPAEAELYVEPARGTALHFSIDGSTWTPLQNESLSTIAPETSVQPLAVGDDEAIFSLMTYGEPPQELLAFESEGREPTDAEIEALQAWENGSDRTEYVRIELS